MNENIWVPLLILVGGFIFSVILYILLLKFSNKILKMFQLYPESQDILKLSLRIMAFFICGVAFLIFLRKALSIIGLNFTVEFIEGIILNSGKYFSAFIVIMLGFYLSRIVSQKFKRIDVKFSPYIYFLSGLIINTAFILTGMTIIGINIIVFLEVYKIILLTIGITLSIIIGIPFGVYISNKINSNKHKQQKPKTKILKTIKRTKKIKKTSKYKV